MSNRNLKANKNPGKALRYPMRLDLALVARKLSYSRSRAEEYIRDGHVRVNGLPVKKASHMVYESDEIVGTVVEEYVSRAGLKLSSVAKKLKLRFEGTTVLDVGSSTGGFTEYALRHGAKKVFAVDVGTDQLHPKLQGNPAIELHEKTDIRNFIPSTKPDIVVMDVSFISVRYILPHIATIIDANTAIAVMVKPQFEAGREQINKGVIKNDTIRRQILKDFEVWSQKDFRIIDKADSDVHGAKGNQERFYLIKKR